MADDETLKRFGEAVEEKKKRSKEASEREHPETPGGSPADGDQADLASAARTQDELDARAKSSRKGKVTADKWNQ